MATTSTHRRSAPLTAAQQAAIERQYRESRRKVDAATVDVERAQYLKTLEAVGGLVARARAEGVRPDRRPEAIRKNAGVIRRARLSAFEKKRDAHIALGHERLQATELALGYPPTPYRRADAHGQFFKHPDRKYLERWIEQRNATLRSRAKSAAAPSRGWRADGVVEHKAVLNDVTTRRTRPGY